MKEVMHKRVNDEVVYIVFKQMHDEVKICFGCHSEAKAKLNVKHLNKQDVFAGYYDYVRVEIY